jgi:hypothetical protein
MGKNSVVRNPLGSTGKKLGINSNSVVGGILNRGLSGGIGGEFGSIAMLKEGARLTGEGLGEITGSNALRKQAMDQAAQAEAETKRQADLSDAMARNAGGDPANIFLGTSRRKRTGGGSSGSAGTQNSQGTGVQS